MRSISKEKIVGMLHFVEEQSSFIERTTKHLNSYHDFLISDSAMVLFNSLRMVIAVEYGMLSNIWSIPHAKREVQYGLKNLQLFSFPIMWLGLTVRKSGTFSGDFS